MLSEYSLDFTSDFFTQLNLYDQEKKCQVHIGEKIFTYSLNQLLFHGKKLQNHFLETKDPFTFSYESNSKVSLSDFCEAYYNFHSLFEGESELVIENRTKKIYKKLANYFEIPSLYSVCKIVYEGRPKVFKLNRNILFDSLPKFRKSLKNFTVNINQKHFKVNISLLAALSDVAFKFKNVEESFDITISSSDIPLFTAFIKFLDGIPFLIFDFDQSSLDRLNSVVDLRCYESITAANPDKLDLLEKNEQISILKKTIFNLNQKFLSEQRNMEEHIESLRICVQVSSDQCVRVGSKYWRQPQTEVDNRNVAVDFFIIYTNLGLSDDQYNYFEKTKVSFPKSRCVPDLLDFFKEAASHQNSNAMNIYGFLLKEGVRDQRDFVSAMKYYKMSADLGNSYGMINCGFGLQEGCLGTVDLVSAMKYYKMAADLGNSYGMIHYGNGLQEGFLGTQDLSGAYKYFKMAAELRNPLANSCLHELVHAHPSVPH